MVRPDHAGIRAAALSHMSTNTPPEHDISHARLDWDEQGQPLSSHYQEGYFSRHNGLAETRHVFLDHNRLAERWSALTADDEFVIGETGFGTGLNFLAAWHLWRQLAPNGARLHFLSVEKFPLHPDDLQRALGLWPELDNEIEALLQLYPAMQNPGFHHLKFDQGQVRLTLIIDEACAGFSQLLLSHHPAWQLPQRPVDAWFLDGFSPAKNPDMWRPELFELMQRLSTPGTTLATFTAAGIVRRGLATSGFEIYKGNGYGHKRDMVYGHLVQAAECPAPSTLPHNAFNAAEPAPWYVNRDTALRYAAPGIEKTQPQPRHAVVIGGGLAGCHSARALAERGWQVTLLEQQPQLATAASGNPQGVLYAKLSHRQETLSDFNLQALQFALRSYRDYWAQGIGANCGVLQLSVDDKTADLHDKLIAQLGQQELLQRVSAEQASHISGVACPSGGLWFPSAGWLEPKAVCEQLLAHPGITRRMCEQVSQLSFDDAQQLWRLQILHPQSPHQESRQVEAPVVIIATANEAREFFPQLPLKPIRGQVTYLQATPGSQRLQTVICGDGYLPPAVHGQHCLGATFNPRNLDLTLTEEDHRLNLATQRQQLPALADSFSEQRICGGRAALRCTTPDYLPLTGALPRYDQLLEDYALLRKNARANIPFAGDYWPGLYLNVGHGSRGLVYTPLCAELLAAQIHGDPSPVGASVERALHPGRFWIRDLTRNKR